MALDRQSSRCCMLLIHRCGILVFTIISLGGCGSQSGSAPQTPSAPTPAVPVRFTVRGVVRETPPNPTPALYGASVELVGGPDAIGVLTEENGAFTLRNLSAQTATIRASQDGYETETKTVVIAADTSSDFALGHTWSSEIRLMLDRLPVVEGLKFKRAPGSGPSYYSPSTSPVAVYVSPAPFSGETGSIAHEVCHSHQDRVARAIGLSLSGYYDTEEGKSFLELTGWSRSGPEPPCESIGCGGYPNALEDSAQVCAIYYDPGHSWNPDFLSRAAPKRYQWAQRWLPK